MNKKLKAAFDPVMIVMLVFIVELFTWGVCNAITSAIGDSEACNVFSSNSGSVTNQFYDINLTNLNVTSNLVDYNRTISQNNTFYNSIVNNTQGGVSTNSDIFIQGLNFVWDGIMGLMNIIISPITLAFVLNNSGAPVLIILFISGIFAIPLLFLIITLFLGRP